MTVPLIVAAGVSIVALILAELLLGRLFEKYVPLPASGRHAVALLIAALFFVGIAVYAQIGPVSSDGRFEYFVRVEEAGTQAPVSSAQVELLTAGRPAETAVSDNNGLARFRLPLSLHEAPADMIVRAANCVPYRQTVAIRADELPLPVLLDCGS